ncbi:MAG: polyprenyl synthetase family protein [Oscillatoria sp. Prado101]|nr:polyprenyl synthetase family protein [Oscillatoria sp. Prado101]
MFSGARLAGSVDQYAQPIKTFARNLGVAFQILNDLNDWRGDEHNKLTSGGDLLAGRPTVLWALALEGLDDSARSELLALPQEDQRPVQERVRRAWELYQQAGVFDKANRLVDKHQQRCEEIADQIEPEALRRLLHYLIAVVLERPEEPGLVPLVAIADN